MRNERLDSFKSFNFGFSDAYTELRENPSLLREGHIDLEDAEEKVVNQHHFLVLGYKGSGKSMISARFQLMASDAPSQYGVKKPVSVQELALADFRQIAPKGFDGQARALWSWVLFILVKIVEQLDGDGLADRASKVNVQDAIKLLRSHGIISASPKTLHKFKATRMETKLSLPKFVDQTWQFDQSTGDQSLNTWIKYLEVICATFQSERLHLILFDGLDDLGPIKEGYAQLLGGLIQAAMHVNQVLRSEGAPIKVVVCCRTDLFERLDMPTKAKVRSDYGIDLQWYQDPRKAERSNLIKLADKRANMRHGFHGSIFDNAFIPRKIDNQVAVKFLATQTRHTPRDFLALLKSIQGLVGSPGVLGRDTILSGLRDYSRLYFRDEMDDALDSYFIARDKLAILEAIGRLRTKSFDRSDFVKALAPSIAGSNLDPDAALSALYECSFIGSESIMENGEKYYRFQHRNQAASAAIEDRFELHPGLWKAYNLT